MLFKNTSYVLLFMIGFYSCSSISSKKKSNMTFSKFSQLWFVKYRKSTQVSKDWIPFKRADVELVHKKRWQERIINDTAFVYIIDSLDDKRIVSAIIQSKKNNGILNIVTYLNMVEEDIKADTSGKNVVLDFYEVPLTKHSSLIFGNVIFNSYTIKMCFADDKTNIYEFMMSLPTNSFSDTHMKEFNQFINNFRYNDASVISIRDSFIINKIID